MTYIVDEAMYKNDLKYTQKLIEWCEKTVPVMNAFTKGKVIERQSVIDGTWIKDSSPEWAKLTEYRVREPRPVKLYAFLDANGYVYYKDYESANNVDQRMQALDITVIKC